jgi:hypothetical protein
MLTARHRTAHTVAPIALPSCDPPALQGDILTAGANGLGAGYVKLYVFCNNGQNPPCTRGDGEENQDVSVAVFASDVRCLKAGPGCAAAGVDYTGGLIARLPLRITDHANGTPVGTRCTDGAGNPPCINATTQDAVFGVPSPPGSCVTTGGSAGSVCYFVTSMNAQLLGSVYEFERAVVSVSDIHVMDLGEDGSAGPDCPLNCGSGDETRFVDPGVFLP